MKPKEIMDTIEVSGARFKIKIYQDEAGWYVVKSDDLKGLSTQGKTLREAKENAIDAAETLLGSKYVNSTYTIQDSTRTGFNISEPFTSVNKGSTESIK